MSESKWTESTEIVLDLDNVGPAEDGQGFVLSDYESGRFVFASEAQAKAVRDALCERFGVPDERGVRHLIEQNRRLDAKLTAIAKALDGGGDA